MPFVTVSTAAGKSPKTLQAITDSVFAAQETVLGVTPGMRFAQCLELQPHQMSFNAAYLQAAEPADVFVIQIVLFSGRTPELKKQFVDDATHRIVAATGTDVHNLLFILVENQRSDWYYASKKPATP